MLIAHSKGFFAEIFRFYLAYSDSEIYKKYLMKPNFIHGYMYTKIFIDIHLYNKLKISTITRYTFIQICTIRDVFWDIQINIQSTCENQCRYLNCAAVAPGRRHNRPGQNQAYVAIALYPDWPFSLRHCLPRAYAQTRPAQSSSWTRTRTKPASRGSLLVPGRCRQHRGHVPEPGLGWRRCRCLHWLGLAGTARGGVAVARSALIAASLDSHWQLEPVERNPEGKHTQPENIQIYKREKI